jgi:hypothetical protein
MFFSQDSAGMSALLLEGATSHETLILERIAASCWQIVFGTVKMQV